MATSIATPVTRSVPRISGQMPKCFSAPRSGFHSSPVRNSETVGSTSPKSPVKNRMVSDPRTKMIKRVVAIEKIAHPISDAFTLPSKTRRAARDRGRRAVRLSAGCCRGKAVIIGAVRRGGSETSRTERLSGAGRPCDGLSPPERRVAPFRARLAGITLTSLCRLPSTRR